MQEHFPHFPMRNKKSVSTSWRLDSFMKSIWNNISRSHFNWIFQGGVHYLFIWSNFIEYEFYFIISSMREIEWKIVVSQMQMK